GNPMGPRIRLQEKNLTNNEYRQYLDNVPSIRGHSIAAIRTPSKAVPRKGVWVRMVAEGASPDLGGPFGAASTGLKIDPD
ncbi:MAG TPA: hypothetical protein VIL46_07305, partial [Gemmataceae bacterium]